jgi:hypothetical protein
MSGRWGEEPNSLCAFACTYSGVVETEIEINSFLLNERTLS